MKQQDFTTAFAVPATPSTVFNAVNNVRQWWSENIEGDTHNIGKEFLYSYQDVHRAKIKVSELVPGKRVVWHVIDNYFKFTQDSSEWKDTDIIFEISEMGGETQLKFTHLGLVPAYECFQICHDAWTHYIQGSLKDLILTGRGNATPREEMQPDIPSHQEAAKTGTTTKSIYHRLLIETPVEKVYDALTTQQGLSGWWTPHTTAKPEVGTSATFAFEPEYFKEMKIVELRPYSKVKWECKKGYDEWIATTITFELEPHRKGAILVFHHDGWNEYTAEFASCSYAWALFLGSLKLLCETGTGTPYPAIQ